MEQDVLTVLSVSQRKLIRCKEEKSSNSRVEKSDNTLARASVNITNEGQMDI